MKWEMFVFASFFFKDDHVREHYDEFYMLW